MRDLQVGVPVGRVRAVVAAVLRVADFAPKKLRVLLLQLDDLLGPPGILFQQFQACIDDFLHDVPQVLAIGVGHLRQLLAVFL